MRLRTSSITLAEYLAARKAGVIFTPENMHRYQRGAKEFAKSVKKGMLFMDLGLGKTVTSATAAHELLLDGKANKVLVVGPPRVAKVTWPNEFKEWSHLAIWDTQVIDGTPAQRAKQCQSPAAWHFVSRSSIVWLVQHFKNKWPYDVVILDESTSFKDHTTSRFKAMRNVTRYIKYLWELTATPTAEGYEYLFAQTFLVDDGARLGKSRTAYLDKYFHVDKYTYAVTPLPGAEEEIMQAIADICLVMRAEDYLDVKKPQIVTRKVDIGPEAYALYREMEAQSVLEMEDEIGLPDFVLADTAASLSAKLRQLCSGVLYQSRKIGVTDSGKPKIERTVYDIHTAKLDELDEIIDELQGDSVLIAYDFQSSRDRLAERYKDLVFMDKDGKAIDKWNAGKIKKLAMHPQAGAHGLNLQRGGHNIVFYDIPASLELYLQYIGRLARQGQSKLVKVMLLVASHGGEQMADDRTVDGLTNKGDGLAWFKERILQIRRKMKRYEGVI